MWAQNLFSITLFLTGFMLGSLSSEQRYSEVKVRKYLMNNVGVKFSDETLDLLLTLSKYFIAFHSYAQLHLFL